MSVFNLSNTNIPYLAIATGQDEELDVIHKFGYVHSVGSNDTPVSICSHGGLYHWLESASQLTVVSTSSDTMSMTIKGLDSNYDSLEEVVTLNGTTSVTTVDTFMRVYRMYVDADNAGTITAKVGSDIIAQIDAGESQTLMSVYTVPRGYTAYLMGMDISVNKSKDAQVKMYARDNGNFRIKHVAEIYQNQYNYKPNIPMKLNEMTDIDFRVTEVENSNTRVSCNFELVLDKCLNY